MILSPKKWRPTGWLGTDHDMTLAEVDQFHKGHIARGWVTKKGVVTDACPEKRREAVEQVACNNALLRDCWSTPSIVWQIVELFFGRQIVTDPFWNPWGNLHPLLKLDGSPGFDGFAVDDDKRPKYWRGPVGANGPHSATSATPLAPDGSDEVYARGGWLKMASQYGATEQCAAVIPLRGDNCLMRWGMHADIILEFGRLDFGPPPGIKASSNPGCTAALLWLPNRECSAPARRLFEQGSYRFERPASRKHKITGRKSREVLVRPGVTKYDPETDNLLRLSSET